MNDLLLTTRGRRTGELRRTALVYGVDSDRYILVASDRGANRHPAWYLLLRVGKRSLCVRDTISEPSNLCSWTPVHARLT
ncbi:nitroreductase/quinone reductase family protein [Nonomuraea sp. NPDC047897]|uniref:nitroreductase/quinone reductase family protein n=1 Tax=Nonomuraea sp. NPDC047897 TaxID=3364346 RepID=UPI0037213FA4